MKQMKDYMHQHVKEKMNYYILKSKEKKLHKNIMKNGLN